MSCSTELEWFMNKVSCKFVVITHDVDCQVVTEKLSIVPTRCVNKGDKIPSKYSQGGTHSYGIWEISAPPVISADVNVSSHIKYFHDILGGKLEIINEFKSVYQFECVFLIDIYTEDAGAGFSLYKEELDFIHSISTRYDCHIMFKERIKV